MDPWDNSIDHRLRHRRDHRHPSFSSTLLDQIYRSIDDSSANNSDITMRKKQQHRAESLDENRDNRRIIATDFGRSRTHKTPEPVFFKHSSSSSSDSSGFSSSESDSFYRRSRSSRRCSPPPVCHPKPIRTTVERFERLPSSGVQKPNNKQEHGSFLRTKSKALKIYSDLKKVKQPISPGGRLASFLNSLFTGAGSNTKKPSNISTVGTPSTTRSAVGAAASSSTTTCSTASSFSRSCLSKTTSSSEKSKRSVRFCPVNIIHDEDSRPYDCYNRNINDAKRNRDANRQQNLEIQAENRRAIEAAKELLRNYQKNKDLSVMTTRSSINADAAEDEDDDAASCASSDLFELDNLSAIGIDRYREELPVYETTRLNTNRIISR